MAGNPVSLAAGARLRRAGGLNYGVSPGAGSDEVLRLALEGDPAPAVRFTAQGLGALAAARDHMTELEHEYATRVGAKRWATVRDTLEELFSR